MEHVDEDVIPAIVDVPKHRLMLAKEMFQEQKTQVLAQREGINTRQRVEGPQLRSETVVQRDKCWVRLRGPGGGSQMQVGNRINEDVVGIPHPGVFRGSDGRRLKEPAGDVREGKHSRTVIDERDRKSIIVHIDRVQPAHLAWNGRILGCRLLAVGAVRVTVPQALPGNKSCILLEKMVDFQTPPRCFFPISESGGRSGGIWGLL